MPASKRPVAVLAVALLAALLLARADADALSDALSSLPWATTLEGRFTSRDGPPEYLALSQCYYLEAENVTRRAPPLGGWGQGPCQVAFVAALTSQRQISFSRAFRSVSARRPIRVSRPCP